MLLAACLPAGRESIPFVLADGSPLEACGDDKGVIGGNDEFDWKLAPTKEAVATNVSHEFDFRNSLRAIVKLLFDVADDAIVGVEIPTGNPLVIELDAGLKPTSARYLDESRATALPPI